MSLVQCGICREHVAVKTTDGNIHCLNKQCESNAVTCNVTLKQILGLAGFEADNMACGGIQKPCEAWSLPKTAQALEDARSVASPIVDATQPYEARCPVSSCMWRFREELSRYRHICERHPDCPEFSTAKRIVTRHLQDLLERGAQTVASIPRPVPDTCAPQESLPLAPRASPGLATSSLALEGGVKKRIPCGVDGCKLKYQSPEKRNAHIMQRHAQSDEARKTQKQARASLAQLLARGCSRSAMEVGRKHGSQKDGVDDGSGCNARNE